MPEMTAANAAPFGLPNVSLSAKASPSITLTPGQRSRTRSTKSGSNSTAAMRSAATPRRISASVTTPVPGPSSSTGPSRAGSTWAAMARASAGLDGVMAPTPFGLAISPRRKSHCSAIGLAWALCDMGTSLEGTIG
jgi:hypothetical protein